MKLIGRTGAVAGRDAVVGESLRIGAAADNDFRVEITGISRHHARIVHEGADYWLEDSGSTNGTFVNGLRVARERLRHLDVVTLGRGVDLIAVASSEPATIIHQAVHNAWLEPIDVQSGSRIDIPLGEVTLGRSAPSNVLLDSPLVSHLHARLERTQDHLVLSDLGSSNGTFVNGRLIKEPVELADGDTLSIAGSRQFRVCIEGDTLRERSPMPDSARTPVFDSEWKTRLVWSADELVELEAERQRILAVWKKEQALAAAAPPQAAKPKPDRPAAAEPRPDHKPAPQPRQPPAISPKPQGAVVDPAAAPAPAKAPIRFVKLSGTSGSFKLGPGRHDVGRADSIAITLLSPQVSRVHAAIIVAATEAHVEDAKSANGTLINGVRVPTGGTAPIKTGDRLAFGNVEFTVELVS